MSFTAVWLLTLLRSLLLTVIALPVCGFLVRWVQTSPAKMRGWQLSLLALPFLFPELLTGYAYSQMTRLLITGKWTREIWFDLLLLLRVIPIGTILWYCSPPSPMSQEAWHARRLALRPDEPRWRRCVVLTWYWLNGPARTALFAACGLFFMLFQEFELASLLATTSWTVWLFDAQAGGLTLAESLRCCLAPAFCTWLVCGSLPWQVCGSRLRSAHQSAALPSPSVAGRVMAWCYLALALAALVMYPCLLIGRETIPGLIALSENPVQSQGLVQGILMAGGSALIAGWSVDLLAGWLVKGGIGTAPRWRWLILLASGIGLCGPLIISLVMVAVFQNSWLQSLYDTPLPIVLGQMIWLLPCAILLQGMLMVTRSEIAEHSARLLATGGDTSRRKAARELLWQLRGRNMLAVRLLLCYWAYWDLTLAGVLTPSGMTSAPVRLYIDIHFGRNALLTAKAAFTLAAPLLLILICWPLIKRTTE